MTTLQRSFVRAGFGLLGIFSLGLAALAQDGPAAHVKVASPAPDAAGSASDSEERTPRSVPGEVLPAEFHGPSFVESLDAVLERERNRPEERDAIIHRLRNGASGSWVVPSRGATFYPHSGEHYATNKWGDTRMGIGFGASVDLVGAWISGQGGRGAWAPALQVIGYRDGEEVARTAWFDDVDDEPSWFAIDLEGVDRVELVAKPAIKGAGFYALDDLTFERAPAAPGEDAQRVVLDFEDLSYRAPLTGAGYGGLTWETGSGSVDQEVEEVHAPQVPAGVEKDPRPSEGQASFLGGAGTAPTLIDDFVGPALCEPGACWIPPDTCGVIGPDHFVSVVNQRMAIYDKTTGSLVSGFGLDSFFNTGGSFAGDPRIAFDHFSDRWVVHATEFSAGIWLAVSTSDDPTGSWFKTFVTLSAGSDAGFWPDYPTLGFDQDGIYVGAFMVGGNFDHSLFAIDKAPLVDATPSLGTVTAWRQLPWEGALQPCATYGTPAGAYVISVASATQLRVQRIDGPMTSPSLTQVGMASIPFHSSPPLAPAMGSTVDINTVDFRLMNAVYRNGSIWTSHAIDFNGRAAVRWYEVDASSATTLQTGTVSDTELSYYFPGIAVNSVDDVLLGFSGSSPNQFVGAYTTGRVASDPAGEMAPPALLQAGAASYELVDGSGRNRWGDYSLSSVDPDDDLTLWTIQEYARSEGDTWGTWIGAFEFDTAPGELGTRYCTPAVPNSTGQGGRMVVFGLPTVADDNLVLTANQLPVGSNIGYFIMGQGTNVFTPPGSAGPICVTPGPACAYLPPVEQHDRARPAGSRATSAPCGPQSRATITVWQHLELPGLAPRLHRSGSRT